MVAATWIGSDRVTSTSRTAGHDSGREFSDHRDDAVYAASPSLEAMHVTCGDVATMGEDKSDDGRHEGMAYDVSRGNAYAPATIIVRKREGKRAPSYMLPFRKKIQRWCTSTTPEHQDYVHTSACWKRNLESSIQVVYDQNPNASGH